MSDQRERAIEAVRVMLRHDPLRNHTRMTSEQLDLDARVFAAQIVEAYERVMAESAQARAKEVDEVFDMVYQDTVDFIAGHFGDKETYRVFGRFLLAHQRQEDVTDEITRRFLVECERSVMSDSFHIAKRALEVIWPHPQFTEDERKAILIVLYGQEPPGRSPCYHWETVQRHDRLVASARAKLEKMGQ
jgi:hypothetical protein